MQVTVEPPAVPEAYTVTVCGDVELVSPDAETVMLPLGDETVDVPAMLAVTPLAPGVTAPRMTVVSGYDATFAHVT